MAEEGEEKVISESDSEDLVFLSQEFAREAQLEPWMVRFLEAYARSGILWEACKIARVSHHSVQKAKDTNAGFKEAFEAAAKSPYNRIKRRAIEIAEEGTKKGIYFQGQLCATETEWDTGLMWNFLKTGLRDEFGDKLAVDLASVNVDLAAELPDWHLYIPDLERRMAALLVRAGMGGVKPAVE